MDLVLSFTDIAACTSFLDSALLKYFILLTIHSSGYCGLCTEVHSHLKRASVRPKQREARNACHELLQSLLGRAVQLVFHHTDVFVSMQ